MKTNKTRIRMRLQWQIKEILETEAAWRGVRFGTFVNQCIHTELEKVRAAGIDNCVFLDMDSESGTDSSGGETYEFPTLALRKMYLPTHTPGGATTVESRLCGQRKGYGSQISLFFEQWEIDLLDQLVKKENLRDTVTIFSYRYILVGLLLNSAACAELK